MGDFNGSACYNVSLLHPNRIWQTASVVKSELPVLAFQIIFIALLSRLFFFIYKPLLQPRLLSQISANLIFVGGTSLSATVGFILTKPFIGNYGHVFQYIYPVAGIINIEVLAHIGLIFYAFLCGLEMNLNTILRADKKSKGIAIAGIAFPMVMAPALYALHRKVYVTTSTNKLEDHTTYAYLLWTLIITVTGFPLVVQSLSDLKLLYTGLGRIALTTTMISDTYAWILFTLVVPFCTNFDGAIYSVMCTIVFIVVSIFVLHPILEKFINNKTEKDDWHDGQLIFVVMGVLAFAYLTDLLGTHGIVGAFVYGLILPHGRFSDMVMSVLDDFSTGFLAPIYFAGTGMKLTLSTIFEQSNWHLTLLVVLLLCVPKIISTMLTCFFFGMSNREGLALGLIMNTKGAMALIMLNTAWDRGIFSPATYTVITSAVLLMTVVVYPIINIIYKPRKRFEKNRLKTIEKIRADAELRILACVHNTRQATSMINIIEYFNATRVSPVQVFAVYLVELTRRGAALVAAHMEKPSHHHRVQNLTTTQRELENITNIFEAFREEHDAARVWTSSVMSDYDTIHEDIHDTANEKHTSLILLPFHKHFTLQGVLETTSLAYRDINQKVMQYAPCSVGIYVDRSAGKLQKKNFHIFMLFVGGPHDREAMAVAKRMTGKAGVALTVVRFILLDELAEVDTKSYPKAQGLLSSVMDSEKQKELDDEYVSSFRLKVVNMNDDSISYSEIGVHSIGDINKVLSEIENNGCDLYIVGQGNGRSSRVLSDLLKWCDYPELGVMGDIIASKDIVSRSSLLVVQQYGYGGMTFGKDLNLVTNNHEV